MLLLQKDAPHKNKECIDLLLHTHSSTHVSWIAEAIILDWINLLAENEKQGRVSVCTAWSCGVWRGQIISNESCKSPQSSAGRQWVMHPTPSQWDYMNKFIGQQKAKRVGGGYFPYPWRPVHLYWWHARLIFEFSSLAFSIEMLCPIKLAALADDC